MVPGGGRLTRALHIVEEIGELVHEERIRAETSQRDDDRTRDAVGDIVVALAGYCTAAGLDMEQCVKEAWREVRERWESDGMAR